MSKNQDLGELINGIKSLATNQLNAPAYTSATAFTGTIAGYLGFDTNGNLLTSAGASQWITTGSDIYYNTGSVGIGTASPQSKLQVQGGMLWLTGLNDNNANIDGVGFFGGNNGGGIYARGNNGSGTFSIGNINGGINIGPTAKVGIGVTSPSASLHITNNTGGSPTIPPLGTINNYVAQYINNGAGGGGYGLMIGTLWSGNAYFQVQRSDGTATAYHILFQPNGGNVGIGTLSPAYKLDVVGDVNITGSFRVNGTPIGTGGGGISGSGTTNYIPKWSAGTALTNSGLYEAGGKLSYGTTTPFYQLDWKIKSNVQIGFGFGTVYSADDSAGLVAHGGGGITNTIPIGFAASTYLFYVGFTEAMRIDTSRNLLVNTSGGVTGGGSVQVNGDVNVTGTFRVNGVQYNTGGGGGGIGGGGTTDFIPKFIGGTTIGNSAMWDNGNFSIHLGMTNFSGTGGDPQRYIAIYGPESSGIIFKGDINDSQATSFIKRTNGVGNLTLYDTREVYLQASSSNYFKMNGSGIGINVQPFGTPYVLTLPNNSLQVAVAFSWLTYSDGRVKKEIKEIKYGINEVMKMKPVQYKHYSSEFINNTLNIGEQYTNEIGFVAQDIHEIVKEAVNRGSDTELWSLDKSKLIPVLVKAVQELKAELDELKQNNT